MTRRDKVELFEQIRREDEFGVGTIAGVARKFGVHRRMVRQAIKNAIPPSRKMPQRNSPALDPVRDFIDQILTDDQKAPRKQRHTAHRIYERLYADFSNHPIAERTVREYVQFWKLANGKARGEIFIPQAYDPGAHYGKCLVMLRGGGDPTFEGIFSAVIDFLCYITGFK